MAIPEAPTFSLTTTSLLRLSGASWLAALDDFRNWSRLGLQARE
jgi:hypothetical protein